MRRACSSGLCKSKEPIGEKNRLSNPRYSDSIYRTLKTLQHDNERTLTIKDFLTLIVPTTRAPEIHLEPECLCSFPAKGRNKQFRVRSHFSQLILKTTWLLTWTNLVSLRSICMRMSSQASHIHVSERCRYFSRVEMWVNLRAILVTSYRQSDNNPVSNWKIKMGK